MVFLLAFCKRKKHVLGARIKEDTCIYFTDMCTQLFPYMQQLPNFITERGHNKLTRPDIKVSGSDQLLENIKTSFHICKGNKLFFIFKGSLRKHNSAIVSITVKVRSLLLLWRKMFKKLNSILEYSCHVVQVYKWSEYVHLCFWSGSEGRARTHACIHAHWPHSSKTLF